MFTVKSAFKHFANQLQQVRFRHSSLNPQQEKVVNQLSVLSAGRKQPKLLKLCNEDYIKHRTVMRAWALVRSNKKKRMQESLRKQYESMEEAAEELKKLSPQLYEIANQHQYGKRFPIELRVPTQYPPRQIWFYDYFPKK
ncbi:hypothetical protein CANINC_003150 [Pichia inconspicua]|uniref:Large ribosomal subunit protein mL40 n=1 Tax=Pichia inconspicua TaxID=52247 RepID=A0A4T0X103_9ASCO|nr:hypothetical protein CANINC_003150 [[Candida] inconspicua]